jgi:hypothetical protein
MRSRLPTIVLLPDTDSGRILRCDLAYHAGAPARDAAKRDAEARQRSVDAILPAFLLPAPEGGARQGSRWTNLADLALSWDQDRGVGFVFDLSTPNVLGPQPPERVLPRGSQLRLLEPYWEMWGFGYVAGVFYDLAVETGPMAGRTVTVGDYARISWANGAYRLTLAAALIVPADARDASKPDEGVRRYGHALTALRDAGFPVMRGERSSAEPLDRAGDLLALGSPDPIEGG